MNWDERRPLNVALADRPSRIPLHARDGSVCDWALVDADVAEELSLLPWHRTHYGYAASRFKGESLLMHRIILDLPKGDPRQADHRNRNRLDNRGANLRIVSAGQNRQNQSKTRGTSRFRGVSLHASGKWVAQAAAHGKHHFLGVFEDEEEAAAVAARFRAEHMPFSEEATR